MTYSYTVYGRMTCPYTVKALDSLKTVKCKVEFVDVIKFGVDKFKTSVVPRGRMPTVPQIFCNGTYVGGCDDLIEDWLPVH